MTRRLWSVPVWSVFLQSDNIFYLFPSPDMSDSALHWKRSSYVCTNLVGSAYISEMICVLLSWFLSDLFPFPLFFVLSIPEFWWVRSLHLMLSGPSFNLLADTVLRISVSSNATVSGASNLTLNGPIIFSHNSVRRAFSLCSGSVMSPSSLWTHKCSHCWIGACVGRFCRSCTWTGPGQS